MEVALAVEEDFEMKGKNMRSLTVFDMVVVVVEVEVTGEVA